MTTAVCYKCGAMKLGAWTPCEKCGSTPITEDDLVISMALSDHHLDMETLTRLGKHVAAGLPVEIDEPSRNNILRMLRSIPPEATKLAGTLGITGLATKPGSLRTRWTFVNQPECGAVRFDDDQRSTMIGGAGHSVTHALGHILLRTIAKPGYTTPDATRQTFENGDVFRAIESWAGVRNGVWLSDKEEQFAQQFEIYTAEINPVLNFKKEKGHLSPSLRQAFQVLCPPKANTNRLNKPKPWWQFW